MRILEFEGRGGSKVAYGREGRRLVAVAKKHFPIFSLDSFELDSVLVHGAVTPFACLFFPGGRAFLEAHGYWKAGEELPAKTSLSVDHLNQLGNLTPLTGFRCFAADGKSVLRESYALPWQSPQRLAVWDFAGVCLRGYPEADLMGRRWAAFSPDGTVLAMEGPGVNVTLLDAVARQPVAELEHTDQVFDLAFSPDGSRLATSAGRTVRVWSVPDGKCLHKFRAFRAYAECVAFSPDGRMLVAGSREGRVRIWEAESGREMCDHDWRQGAVSDVAFSPDGLTAAAACRDAVVVWDVDF